jgi:dihydrofolate synthase/folylpolyglutamate synthase
VVVADPSPPAQLVRYIAQVGAKPALFLGKEFTLAARGGQWQAVLQTASGELHRLPAQKTGAMLPENICAALQALLLLGVEIDEADLPAVLAEAAPRGRRQIRRVGAREFVLDVAHNPAAVAALMDYLRCIPCEGKTIGLFSAMSDKDLPGIVGAAAGAFEAWLLADQPGNARAAKAADIADVLYAAGQECVSVSKNLRQAFRRAQSIMHEGDRLVVFGSFTTVAGILPLLDSSDAASESQAFLKQGEV